MAVEFTVSGGGVTLAGEEAGAGPTVVLLHGLTATRRYVVMGSRLLERTGHHVVSYDARGHGSSSPAPTPGAYTYAELADDLERVLDARGLDRVVLAGASMGAHTLLALALRAPQRVAGAVVITPAFDGARALDAPRLARWDALSAGLRAGGIEGFVRAYGEPNVRPPELAQTVLTVIRQRLALHLHPDAVADALAAVPRSSPFPDLGTLATLRLPVAVVGSGDDADPGHPFAVAERYAQLIPDAELIVDPPGSSPVAWQGSRLSRVIAGVVARTDLGSRAPQ